MQSIGGDSGHPGHWTGYPAGGTTDITARLIGQSLSERLAQSFITENRPGANGNIAAEAVVRASPDGYTLLLTGSNDAVNTTFYDNLKFNFIRDIAPVASIVRTPVVMVVNSSFPAKTVSEFIAYSKANLSKINMASAGIGNVNHVAGELFKMMTGVNMLHVPYRGGAPALADLLGGQVQVFFAGTPESIEYIRAGKLRALAVTTAARSDAVPDIPTVADFFPAYESNYWVGLGAPAKTHPDIIDKLNKSINAGLTDPAIKARFADLGGTVISGSPADFGNLIADETEKWAKVIKSGSMKPE